MEMEELRQRVEEILKDEINPALAQHNGFAELLEVEPCEDSWKVVIEFFGACGGCPSSVGATLQSIEFYLREELSMPKLRVINVEQES
jgi:NifU-like protein